MRIVAEKFPNREISLRILDGERAIAPEVQKVSPLSVDGEGDSLCVPCLDDSVAGHLDIGSENAEKSPKAKPGFGGLPRPTRFGLNAKRIIRRIGGVCDRIGQPQEWVMVTLTLPGSTDEAMKAIASWSAYLLKCLKEWLRYYVNEQRWFYVWEWQRRGALHLHWCIHCPSDISYQLLVERLHSQWTRLLKRVGKKADTDLFARAKGGTWASNTTVCQVNVQRCVKSVAAYFAKYVSKNANSTPGFGLPQKEPNFYYPSRWWGSSQALKSMLQELSEEIKIDNASRYKAECTYEDALSLLSSASLKSYEYKHKVGYGVTQVHFTSQEDLDTLWSQLVNFLKGRFPVMSINSVTTSLRRLSEAISQRPWLYSHERGKLFSNYMGLIYTLWNSQWMSVGAEEQEAHLCQLLRWYLHLKNQSLLNSIEVFENEISIHREKMPELRQLHSVGRDGNQEEGIAASGRNSESGRYHQSELQFM